ncbi:gamma-glutamylcyclotransferase family protein [Trinickia acidisoli]|uniref:gamma-glutamylcyclotransferase family protein n=1 Tax=Trinickia acidisoli TaxID=2767482 RepID=UPI001A9088FD|nr:gamma-glutamylcyclotransferase family protein [Trinickia acidisoli]
MNHGENDSIWYFAYGSNMDPARLIDARLAPAGVACFERVLGRLDDWVLTFDKPSAYFRGAAAANLAEHPGAHVLGVLNRIAKQGLDVLDHYENVASGHYERVAVSILRPESNEYVSAVTYVARNNLDSGLKPRAAYLAHLFAGRDILPDAYLDQLKSLPVCDETSSHPG